MHKVNLAELAEGLHNHKIVGPETIPVGGIQYMSGKVGKNDLFVCIRGNNFDGHKYAKQAVAQGAGSLLVSYYIEDLSVPQVIVDDTRKAMGLLAARFYGDPANKLKMAGVTGTNGKTTTSFMTASIIKAASGSSGIIGTLGIFVGDEKIYEGRTTPESLDIQRSLQIMRSKKISGCVSEISSHAIDQGRHLGCRFDALAFTNLTQDHLDYHLTMEAYKQAKSKLFTDKAVHKDGVAVIYNADDPNWQDIVGNARGRMISYGLGDSSLIQGRILKAGLRGSLVEVINKDSGSSFELDIKMPGIFNISNALAASSIAYSLGYSDSHIVHGLGKLNNVPGRTEAMHSHDGFNIVIDYAHTPDGLSKVLSSLKNCTEGRIITVFGCGGDRDKQKRPLMGKVVDELSDISIVTSDNPRTEDPQQIANETAAGMSGNYHIVIDRRAAIEEAIGIAGENDCVLVAGKGHETYQELNGERRYFNDREVVTEILGSRLDAGQG